MWLRQVASTITAAAILSTAPSRAVGDNLSAESAALVAKVDDALSKTAKAYRRRGFREAERRLAEARQSLASLETSASAEELAELKDRLSGFARRVAAAERLLASAKANATGGVSFTKDVAPLLVANCAGCHISKSEGGLSLASYESLLRGAESGVVVFAGDGAGSRLFEVLDTGDMPRGGERLADEALKAVRAWIDQGAKFDGANPSMALRDLAPTNSEQPAALTATPATGTETVSFAGDIAEILVQNCFDCHGANNPRANLSFVTFARLLAGGNRGLLYAPGKPEESLLIGKLKGTADGARMPMGREPLPADKIQLVETWIAEGGTFDGESAATPLRQLWEEALAKKLSEDELSARRVELAQQHWRLALPDTVAKTFESRHFLLVGNVPQESLRGLAEAAESQRPKIAQTLRLSRDVEWCKGRLTLFAFERRVDYSEFAELVEGWQLPQEVSGHWRHTPLDPYVCIVAPATTEAPPRLPLALQTAGCAIDSLGDCPRWFSQGLARAIAARVEVRDPQVRIWEGQLPASLAALSDWESFTRADPGTGNAALVAYGICKEFLNSGARFSALLTALSSGQPFDVAVSDSFGMNPKALFERWRSATR